MRRFGEMEAERVTHGLYYISDQLKKLRGELELVDNEILQMNKRTSKR